MQRQIDGDGAASEVGARAPVMILGRWRVTFFYGWVIVGVVFLAEFTSSGMGGATLPLFFKPMRESLGWSLSQVVGAVTAATIAGMVVSPFLGPLIDRLGAKPIMLFGSIAAGVGLVLLMYIQEPWQFWVLYAVVSALGLSELGQLTGPVVITKWFVRLRGRAMALGTLGQPVGGVVMAPIIGLLIVIVGWRSAWALMGVILLALMVAPILLFMRSRPEDIGLQPDGGRPTIGATGSEAATAPATADEASWTLRGAMSTRSFWLLIIGFNLVGLSAGAVQVNLVPFFTEQEGMPSASAAWIITAFLGAATFSRLIWGFLVERIPIRICLATVFVARFAGTLSLLVVPYPFNVGSFVLITGLLGGSFGLLQPIVFANYYGRAVFGSISGFLRPLLAVPQLVSPLAVAFLFDRTGSFDLGFLITSFLGLLAAGVVLFAVPPVHRTPSQPVMGLSNDASA